MNLKYMMLKNRYIFSSDPQLTLFSPEDDKRRANEISLFIKELAIYSTNLKLLTKINPPINIKNELLNIAAICAEEDLFYDSIKTNRQLPIKKLSNFTQKSKTFIEKWEYYILAYFLLLSNKNYSRLKSYLNIKNIKADNENSAVVPIQPLSQPKILHNGVILQVINNTVFIITAQGDFIKLKPAEATELSAGQICTGTIKKDLHYYRYPIAIGTVCIFALLLFLSYSYLKPSRTILINANSSVTIKTNSFNKTVDVKATGLSGTKIIKSLWLFNKSIDDSIYFILKEAREKNIMSENTKIIIFITGSAKETPELIKTSAYIAEHNLQVSVNNNGIEHKIKKPSN